MSIKVNINVAVPKINIIKDEEKETTQINQLAQEIVLGILNHPESGEKARAIGEDKLVEMARNYIREYRRAEEEQQISNALEMANSINATLLESLIKITSELGKKL